MLGAIAREIGHAADTVTDAAGAAVQAVLPGKGGNDNDNAPTEDEDVHRKGSDQQQGKQQDKDSKRDQAKVSEDRPAAKAKAPKEDTGREQAKLSEDKPAEKGKPAAPKQDTDKEEQQQQQQDDTEGAAEDAAAPAEPQAKPMKLSKMVCGAVKAAGSAAKAGLKGQAHQQRQQQLQQARLEQQQQQTAGAAPLPKMSKGHASWMKSKTAFYPDRSGILHQPGMFINRRQPVRA